MPKIILGNREFRLSGVEKGHLTESVAGAMEGIAKAIRKERKEIFDESRARAEIYRKLLEPDLAEMDQLSERRAKQLLAKYEQNVRAQKTKARAKPRRRNFCLGHGTCLEVPAYDFAQADISIPRASGRGGTFGHVESGDLMGGLSTNLVASHLSADMSDWAMCAFWQIPDITGTLSLSVNATVSAEASLSPYWFDSPTAVGTFNLGVLQYTRSPFTSQGFKASTSTTLYDFGWNLFGQGTGGFQQRQLSLSVSTQVDPSHYYLCAAWISSEVTNSGPATVITNINAGVHSFNVTVA